MVIAQHPAAAHLSYLDIALGPFIVASNPNFKVGFVNEVLFKHREHGNNSWNSTLSLEMVLCNAERWQSVHDSAYHLISHFLTDKKIERRYTNFHEELGIAKTSVNKPESKSYW